MIAFLAMSAGCLILLNLSPFELASGVGCLFHKRKLTLKKQIENAVKPKKLRGIRRILQETQQVLKLTERMDKFASLSVMSFTLFVVGLVVAASMDNLYLLPVLAIGFSLLPFLYVLLTASKFKKQLNGELESALSTITTSYLRSEDFITAVRENLQYLNPPLLGVFQRFLQRVDMIDPDVVTALEEMKSEIDSSVFHEWLDAAMQCQKDRNLKTTLLPIIAKLSKMRQVSVEVDFQMYKPFQEYASMGLLVLGNIPLVYFLNKDWFQILMYSTPGKLVLAITACVILVSLIQVTRLTRPVEYRR